MTPLDCIVAAAAGMFAAVILAVYDLHKERRQ